MRLFSEAVHRLRHAFEEKRLGLLLAAVAIGERNQFFCFGHADSGEEVGKDGPQ